MQWKWWQWVLLIVLAFSLGPYLLGGLYTWLAVPVYSQVCEGQPFAFLAHPLSQENYTLFLFNKGCNLEEVMEKKKKENEEAERVCGSKTGADRILCYSLWSIRPDYRGTHRWFNDDLIGNLWTNLTALLVTHFKDGVILGAELLVPLMNQNVLLKGVFCLLYAGLIAFLGYLLSNFAHDVYTSLKRILSN